MRAKLLHKAALLLALSMASAGIALASNTSWFDVDTAYGTNGVSEALASTSYGVANAVDHNDVNHRVYSLVGAHNGYVGPFTLTRRLSSGAIDTAFGASGVTTSFANYNDPNYTFYALCIDPVTHGLVLAGEVPGGAVIERLMPPDANGVAALDTSFNGQPPGVVTWGTSRPSLNVRPRGCTVLGDRSIFVAGPDGSTPSVLAMMLVSVDGELLFPFAGRRGVPTPTGDNWEGGSIEWNSSQAINPNLIITGTVSHNAVLYAVDACTGDRDMNFNGDGFLSIPAIDGSTYSDAIVGAVQVDGSILLALLASDTLNADLVGWSYPVVPGSWQTPTVPGTLTVPSGVVFGGGSSPAPVRQADGTILVAAETATNQQVLFALQGDAALGFTVAAPPAFSCGMGAGVAVPNVVNDTQSAATAALTSAGLTLGTVTQQPSSTIASGDVISESPTEGTIVAGGTAVSLVMSTGSGNGGSSGGGAYGGGSLDWLLLTTLFGAWLTLTGCQKRRRDCRRNLEPM